MLDVSLHSTTQPLLLHNDNLEVEGGGNSGGGNTGDGGEMYGVGGGGGGSRITTLRVVESTGRHGSTKGCSDDAVGCSSVADGSNGVIIIVIVVGGGISWRRRLVGGRGEANDGEHEEGQNHNTACTCHF